MESAVSRDLTKWIEQRLGIKNTRWSGLRLRKCRRISQQGDG